ncbi:MAG: hypothetical protein ACK518_04320 [bacterium]
MTQHKKSNIMAENTRNEIYLDIDGTMEILKSRGRKVSVKETAKELGYSTVGMMNLRKKAPKQIEALYWYLKDNMLTFEDLVKERE